MAIKFFEEDVKAQLLNRRKLGAFMQSMIQEGRKEVKSISLLFVFCNDSYLKEINQRFLNHDTYTDIITFDLSENPGSLNAEIYISVERVRENAEEFKVSYEHELHRVLFHGVLHLMGYKDKKTADRKRMREEENNCLDSYFRNGSV